MTHYLIYKITNRINGKIYIGQHQTEDLNDDYMGSGKGICRAIKKYGKENFTKEILFYCTDWETMNSMEEMLVDNEFVSRKDTYNMKTGGSCGILSEEVRRRISESMKGKPAPWNSHPKSEETRKKISDIKKGKQHSEETRRKISESLKGRSAWNKGKHLSEERKRRISETMKEKSKSEEWRRHLSHLSEAHKGKHLSEETKRKISDSKRRLNEAISKKDEQ